MRRQDLEFRLAHGWIGHYGIRSLPNIYNEDWMLASYIQLADAWLEYPLRACYTCRVRVEDMSGLSWFRLDAVDTNSRLLNIDHIILRYPVDDSARDLWFYLIFVACVKGKTNFEIECEWESISWWDLARFHTLYPGVLPTMREMRDQLKGRTLPRA